MSDLTEALKLIIAKSPRAAQEAITTIAAARNNSPVTQIRYARVLQMALSDPDATFTPDDRSLLASGIEEPGELGRGRPTKYGATMRQSSIWLPIEMLDWLKAQPGGVSETIRELIRVEMDCGKAR